jgi:hypothetical protein
LSRLIRLDSDRVVDGVPKPLLAAQVSLRRLNADVSKQEANLLQFSAGPVTQSGARPAKVVRSDISM